MVNRKRKNSINPLLVVLRLATCSFVSVFRQKTKKTGFLQNTSCYISIEAKFDADFENVYFFLLIFEEFMIYKPKTAYFACFLARGLKQVVCLNKKESIHFRNQHQILRRLVCNMTYFEEHQFFRFLPEEGKQMSEQQAKKRQTRSHMEFSLFLMTIHNFLDSYREILTRKRFHSPHPTTRSTKTFKQRRKLRVFLGTICNRFYEKFPLSVSQQKSFLGARTVSALWFLNFLA